jgi:hypothetical protein
MPLKARQYCICGVAAHFYCHAFCTNAQYGTLLSFVILSEAKNLATITTLQFKLNKKAKRHAKPQTKNHANKNGLKLLKHNVVLCVRYAQPCLRSFTCRTMAVT